MIYILAVFLPPLALLLNGQPLSALLNLVILVPCLMAGVLGAPAGAIASRRAGNLHEAGEPQAPRDRRRDRAAWTAAGLAELTGRACTHL
jgi:hypothetical protein